jgi:hypothetical protein
VTAYAKLTTLDQPGEIACEFNPSTVKVTKSATWHTHPSRHSKAHPRPQFVGTGPQSLTANLLFNAFDRNGRPAATPVPVAVQQLLDWTKPTQISQEAGNSTPPKVMFSWGSLVMIGFLSHVEVDYLLFGDDGVPLRATATVAIQSIPQPTPGTNPTSGGISGRRSAQATQGDSLASIAQREYGDAGLWRAIAIANDIDDPGRVPPGTRLLLPPRAQAVALSAVGGDPR